MNPVRILFIAPIYSETEMEYYSRLDAEDRCRMEKQAQTMKKFLSKDACSSAVDKEIAGSMPPNPYRKAWRYNRIVGWIEFYTDRRTIKADWWLSKGKKLPKTFKSVTFENKGKIGDVKEGTCGTSIKK